MDWIAIEAPQWLWITAFVGLWLWGGICAIVLAWAIGLFARRAEARDTIVCPPPSMQPSRRPKTDTLISNT
jgi:hypothetical protein